MTMCDIFEDDGWWERNAIYWKGQADERLERLNSSIAYAEELESKCEAHEAHIKTLMQSHDSTMLTDTESIRLCEAYIGYVEVEGGPLSGTLFRIVEDSHVDIFQEIDDEDESDKYTVVKEDVPKELWEHFLVIARAGEQF